MAVHNFTGYPGGIVDAVLPNFEIPPMRTYTVRVVVDEEGEIGSFDVEGIDQIHAVEVAAYGLAYQNNLIALHGWRFEVEGETYTVDTSFELVVTPRLADDEEEE